MAKTAYEIHKDWARRNPEKRRAQKRRWYVKNQVRIRERNMLVAAERVAKNAAYYAKNPAKLVERTLRFNHGIGLNEYYALSESQNGKCAICKIPHEDTRQGKLHVDHDHANEIIRGLLCESCNRMLGLAKDSPEILLSAAAYLQRDGG